MNYQELLSEVYERGLLSAEQMKGKPLKGTLLALMRKHLGETQPDADPEPRAPTMFDTMDFGKLAGKTYQQAFLDKQYTAWCKNEVRTSKAPSPQLKRYVSWVLNQEVVEEAVSDAKAKTEAQETKVKKEEKVKLKKEVKEEEPSGSASAASSRMDRIENLLADLLRQQAAATVQQASMIPTGMTDGTKRTSSSQE